jgi:hypothetical protein
MYNDGMIRFSGIRWQRLILGILFVWTIAIWAIWLRGSFLGDYFITDDCLYMDVVRNLARSLGLTTHTAYPQHLMQHREVFSFPLPYIVHGIGAMLVYAAGYWISGMATVAPLIVNGILFLLTNFFAYRLAHLLAGPRTALMALALLSLQPLLYSVNMWINTQPLFLCLLMAASYYLFRFIETPRARLLVVVAILFTAAQYCRIGIILLYLPVAALIVLRGGWKSLALFAGISGVLLIPWAVYFHGITGMYNYSPYYIATNYAFEPDNITFTMTKYGVRELLERWPITLVARQLYVFKDIYKDIFHWMNPIVLVAAFLSFFSQHKPGAWNDYRWYCFGMSLFYLMPGLLSSHAYLIIYFLALPAASFLLDWLQKIKDRSQWALAICVLAVLLLQSLLIGTHATCRDNAKYRQYLSDWKSLGPWVAGIVKPQETVYSNGAELVAWHADRNALFVNQNERETRKSFERYPSDWILITNVEGRFIGGDPAWNDFLRHGYRQVDEFLGFRRFKAFEGKAVQAVLFRRIGS